MVYTYIYLFSSMMMNLNIFRPGHVRKHIQNAGKKVKNRRNRKSNLNTFLIVIAVIFIRRGIWGLLDIYLFPDRPMISMLISIGIGMLILYRDDKKFKELSE